MSGNRSPLARYWVELGAVTALGVVLVLGLLWLLHAAFPKATGLGNFVGSRGGAEGKEARGAEAQDSATIAVLSSFRRDVRQKPGSSVVWSAATAGMPLSDGQAIQSYENSGATIAFDDKNVIEIGEKSVIVLRKPREDAGSGVRRAAVLFMDGFLRGHIGPAADGAAAVEVVAGGGIVRPHDVGAGNVDLALAVDKNTSELSVRQGKADVVWNGKTTVVPAGYMVSFDAQTAPGTPLALPKPVTPVSPAADRRFLHRGAPPPVPFSWRPQDDTSDFTIQISRDASFDHVVQTFRRSATGFTFGNFGDGTYYWRVIGRRGTVEGQPSSASRFTVERQEKPPALTVEFPTGVVTEASIVLRGATDPGCRVVIGDRDVPIDALGHFEHSLAVRDGYNFLVVQAIDPTGNTAFDSHTVVAKLVGAKEPR